MDLAFRGVGKNGLQFEAATKKWEESDDNVREVYDFKIKRKERDRVWV